MDWELGCFVLPPSLHHSCESARICDWSYRLLTLVYCGKKNQGLLPLSLASPFSPSPQHRRFLTTVFLLNTPENSMEKIVWVYIPPSPVVPGARDLHLGTTHIWPLALDWGAVVCPGSVPGKSLFMSSFLERFIFRLQTVGCLEILMFLIGSRICVRSRFFCWSGWVLFPFFFIIAEIGEMCDYSDSLISVSEQHLVLESSNQHVLDPVQIFPKKAG